MADECAQLSQRANDRPRRLTWFGVLLAICLGEGFQARAADGDLHTAAEVRALTVEQARQKSRVHLRGVVTFFEESLYSRFIQDETAGIYLFDSGLPVHFSPGQLVEVEGTTSPGEYAPIIVPESFRVIGEAPLPRPKAVTYEQLASGKEDSQFVEIAGIVRSVQLHEGSRHHLIEIATGGGRLSVYARELPVERTDDLLDSTVRVRGVCSTQFNHQRQLFAIRLLVPRPEDLVIEQPAPPDPFAIPARPIGSLLQFTPQESFGHRVKVSGSVIHYEPGRALLVQAGEQGLEVQTRERSALQLGDVVEVLGFPAQGEYTPILQDAIFRKVNAGEPPRPIPVTPDEALKGKYDCRLVQLEGALLDRAQYGRERYLILQDSGFTFHAYLTQTDGEDLFAALENGSRVAVTGVCRIDPGEWAAGEQWRAKSFRVQLRSASDVALLKAPSWWTLKKVFWMAAALGLVALVAFGWVAVLHRQVAERTRELEAEIQERQRAERRREIEQERTRVAQDLHDELGATLTEVSMLSSLAGTPSLPAENRERYLKQLARAARSVVATLDEIVWAVNPKYDSIASLASYYSLFAQRFLNLAGMGCRLRVDESFPEIAMDSRLRHSLFLAFKEALNNAVCHSAAAEVRIALALVDNHLKITIADNGCGFSLNEVPPGSDGLASMRDRLQKLGGECVIQSTPGSGTTVEFQLPLGEGQS